MRILVFVEAFVAGCATSPFPEDLARSADRTRALREFPSDATVHLGRRVILGGEILATTLQPGETAIEVLSRRLRAGDEYPPLPLDSPSCRTPANEDYS